MNLKSSSLTYSTNLVITKVVTALSSGGEGLFLV